MVLMICSVVLVSRMLSCSLRSFSRHLPMPWMMRASQSGLELLSACKPKKRDHTHHLNAHIQLYSKQCAYNRCINATVIHKLYVLYIHTHSGLSVKFCQLKFL